MIVTSLCFLSLPSFFSTVTPGQLPTNWLEPVSALNKVVLPQLGLPARAILISIYQLSSLRLAKANRNFIKIRDFSRRICKSELLNLNHFSIGFSERKFIISYSNFNRISERSNFSDVNFNTLCDAHIHNSAFDSTFTVKLNNLYGFTYFCLF